ncbi:MAG: hypothetical protein WAM75_11505 [Xanthobacteraceae bacterium]
MIPRSEMRYSDLETLAAVIARSQIVVQKMQILMLKMVGPKVSPRRALPSGFDDTDIAILEWIAAEGRRAARSMVLI